jgi:hypothetical protein
VKVIAETLILCGFFVVIIRFVDTERTVEHHSLHFHFIMTFTMLIWSDSYIVFSRYFIVSKYLNYH